MVLRQVSIGDADRILTLFTPDLGKLRAVARGARRPKSKLGGHVELLNHVRLSLAQGRTLDVVTQADAIRTFRRAKDDLDRLSQGLYMADLVNSFTAEESPSYAVYKLLLASLDALDKGEAPPLTLRYFETKLLFHSGYQPELFNCVHCRSKLDPSDHLFSFPLGGIICPDCLGFSSSSNIQVSLSALKVLRYLQREGYPRAASVNVPATLAGELERVLRDYVGYLLEREVKSASFMGLLASKA